MRGGEEDETVAKLTTAERIRLLRTALLKTVERLQPEGHAFDACGCETCAFIRGVLLDAEPAL